MQVLALLFQMLFGLFDDAPGPLVGGRLGIGYYGLSFFSGIGQRGVGLLAGLM